MKNTTETGERTQMDVVKSDRQPDGHKHEEQSTAAGSIVGRPENSSHPGPQGMGDWDDFKANAAEAAYFDGDGDETNSENRVHTDDAAAVEKGADRRGGVLRSYGGRFGAGALVQASVRTMWGVIALFYAKQKTSQDSYTSYDVRGSEIHSNVKSAHMDGTGAGVVYGLQLKMLAGGGGSKAPVARTRVRTCANGSGDSKAVLGAASDPVHAGATERAVQLQFMNTAKSPTASSAYGKQAWSNADRKLSCEESAVEEMAHLMKKHTEPWAQPVGCKPKWRGELKATEVKRGGDCWDGPRPVPSRRNAPGKTAGSLSTTSATAKRDEQCTSPKPLTGLNRTPPSAHQVAPSRPMLCAAEMKRGRLRSGPKFLTGIPQPLLRRRYLCKNNTTAKTDTDKGAAGEFTSVGLDGQAQFRCPQRPPSSAPALTTLLRPWRRKVEERPTGNEVGGSRSTQVRPGRRLWRYFWTHSSTSRTGRKNAVGPAERETRLKPAEEVAQAKVPGDALITHLASVFTLHGHDDFSRELLKPESAAHVKSIYPEEALDLTCKAESDWWHVAIHLPARPRLVVKLSRNTMSVVAVDVEAGREGESERYLTEKLPENLLCDFRKCKDVCALAVAVGRVPPQVTNPSKESRRRAHETATSTVGVSAGCGWVTGCVADRKMEGLQFLGGLRGKFNHLADVGMQLATRIFQLHTGPRIAHGSVARERLAFGEGSSAEVLHLCDFAAATQLEGTDFATGSKQRGDALDAQLQDWVDFFRTLKDLALTSSHTAASEGSADVSADVPKPLHELGDLIFKTVSVAASGEAWNLGEAIFGDCEAFTRTAVDRFIINRVCAKLRALSPAMRHCPGAWSLFRRKQFSDLRRHLTRRGHAEQFLEAAREDDAGLEEFARSLDQQLLHSMDEVERWQVSRLGMICVSAQAESVVRALTETPTSATRDDERLRKLALVLGPLGFKDAAEPAPMTTANPWSRFLAQKVVMSLLERHGDNGPSTLPARVEKFLDVLDGISDWPDVRTEDPCREVPSVKGFLLYILKGVVLALTSTRSAAFVETWPPGLNATLQGFIKHIAVRFNLEPHCRRRFTTFRPAKASPDLKTGQAANRG